MVAVQHFQGVQILTPGVIIPLHHTITNHSNLQDKEFKDLMPLQRVYQGNIEYN